MKRRSRHSLPQETLASRRFRNQQQKHGHSHRMSGAEALADAFRKMAPYLPYLLPLFLEFLFPPADAYDIAYDYVGSPKKQRNRFQKFFYRLSLRIERACSSIENRIASLQASGNDFPKIGKPNYR